MSEIQQDIAKDVVRRWYLSGDPDSLEKFIAAALASERERLLAEMTKLRGQMCQQCYDTALRALAHPAPATEE